MPGEYVALYMCRFCGSAVMSHIVYAAASSVGLKRNPACYSK